MHQTQPTPPSHPPQRVFQNASLHTLRSGQLPRFKTEVAGSRPGETRALFVFLHRSGYQFRRQIGEGHSRAERTARREARRFLRTHASDLTVEEITQRILAAMFEQTRRNSHQENRKAGKS